MNKDINIAEIFFDSGEIKQRYTRYLSEDGRKWVRHGLYRAYHRNGQLATEGKYVHGLEEGIWRDYHENGRLAAEGFYKGGKEFGEWKTWNDRGELEPK